MPWDKEALTAIMKAPKFVRKVAVGNVEDYAQEHDIDKITLKTVKAQAEQVGMGRFMSDLGAKPGGILKRLFGKR
ncbi:MAG: hypothetical protein V7709_04275 [Halioglobus sp.]